MPLHKNLSADELHFPLGRSSEGALLLEDDLANAYQIKHGSVNEINISTVSGAETITLGNGSENPTTIIAGTGPVGIGAVLPASPNGNTKVVEIEGESVGLVLHSTSGGGTPYEIQNNSETFRIQYDTTNRLTIDSSGNIGFGADPSSPNGNAKAVEIKDTSVGLVLNSTNGGAVPWEIQHNGGDLKFIYDGAGTPKTAIALDAEGAMRLGSEVATPTAPASGDGGQVYVKSDGILYYQSDTVAETDLTDSTGTGSGNFDDLTVDTDTLVANLAGYTDKVGIGTATPSTLLHVDAGANPTANIAVFEGSNAGENNIHVGAAISANNEMVIGFHYGGGAGSADNYGYMMLNGEAPGAGFAVADGGKIGIGTTAPDKALEVNSADGNNLRLTYNDASGSATTYADLQVSSSGHIAIRSSATKGQGALITKTVVQSISDAGVKTYSASELLSGYIIRDPVGSDRSDVFPDATDIVSAIGNCAVNDSFRFIIKNAADAEETITMTAGSGITITGTATIARNNTKEFLCVITDPDGSATIYSLGTWTH